MPTRQQLSSIDSKACFWPGQDAKPACSQVIEGAEYSVRYHLTNRKCFDSLATPTACYKINGKRVSRAAFYGSAQ